MCTKERAAKKIALKSLENERVKLILNQSNIKDISNDLGFCAMYLPVGGAWSNEPKSWAGLNGKDGPTESSPTV